MDCEREGCGHPLALHDPCTVKGCRCGAYEPAGRKARVAELTDIPEPRTAIAEIRAKERRRLGGLR